MIILLIGLIGITINQVTVEHRLWKNAKSAWSEHSKPSIEDHTCDFTQVFVSPFDNEDSQEPESLTASTCIPPRTDYGSFKNLSGSPAFCILLDLPVDSHCFADLQSWIENFENSGGTRTR